MLRGAFILALGYIAGYSHAASQNAEIARVVQDIKRAWAEADAQTETDNTTEGEIVE